jgi:hypothetical protein
MIYFGDILWIGRNKHAWWRIFEHTPNITEKSNKDTAMRCHVRWLTCVCLPFDTCDASRTWLLHIPVSTMERVPWISHDTWHIIDSNRTRCARCIVLFKFIGWFQHMIGGRCLFITMISHLHSWSSIFQSIESIVVLVFRLPIRTLICERYS